MKRRHFFYLLGAAGALAASRLGCFRLARPGEASGPLSLKARVLIERAWKGLDPKRVIDTHVHVVGMGSGCAGCYVNPSLMKLSHPVNYAKFSIYRIASGVDDPEKGAAQYAQRLVELMQAQQPHGRALLLAFDQVHGEDGKPVQEHSEFYTPNEHVLKLAAAHPDLFVPCASVHPYRQDALTELEASAKAGAVAVKWLPNAMRIDPSSPRCDAFYDKLAALGLPLITHAGEEKAVEAEEAQRFGNPLHLRRALDRNVKVVVAHCASLGKNPDLDAKVAQGDEPPWLDNFELFMRLMGEERYRGKLYGDLSALPQFNRVGTPLTTVLTREELGARVVNGSDYPLPAINVLMQTGSLESRGFINSQERQALNEIDQHNPLLFDFVLKRTVRAKAADGREGKFPDGAFMVRPELFPGLA